MKTRSKILRKNSFSCDAGGHNRLTSDESVDEHYLKCLPGNVFEDIPWPTCANGSPIQYQAQLYKFIKIYNIFKSSLIYIIIILNPYVLFRNLLRPICP